MGTPGPKPGAAYRVEVRLREDGPGYDLMVLTHSQVDDDALGQYEKNLDLAALRESGTTP